jgi:addiction module RelE/StbE family toxin
MKILYSYRFAREYKKLPKEIQVLAEEKEKIFRKDQFNSKLKTHKLHGPLCDFWAFSVDNKYRIIFEISKDKKLIYFHSIGDHDIYE